MTENSFEVITTMNREYYNLVGHKMLFSYLKTWPCKLNLYWENMADVPSLDGLTTLRNEPIYVFDLFGNEPECKKFVDRHRKRQDQQDKYELHRGAVRFSYKTFTILNGTQTSDSQYVIWLDADTYTHTPVTFEFLNTLVDPKKHLTYLGRDDNYSECGFVIYNTHHPHHQKFMDIWRELYEKDTVFDLPQWHDSFVFDCIRLKLEKEIRNYENTNLSPWGKGYDHVFVNSILGDYMDHMKGPRKHKGITSKEDITNPERKMDANYWK